MTIKKLYKKKINGNKARHYIDNEKFLQLLKDYNAQKKEPKIISEELGQMFLLLVDNVAYSRNFINYSDDWKNEMKSDALYNCCNYVDRFDINKYTNPYGYFTQVVFHAFMERIKKEKKKNEKDSRLRAEIFEEFLSEEGLYKRKTIDVEDESNIVFEDMDKIKHDLEEMVKENETVKDEGIEESLNDSFQDDLR